MRIRYSDRSAARKFVRLHSIQERKNFLALNYEVIDFAVLPKCPVRNYYFWTSVAWVET